MNLIGENWPFGWLRDIWIVNKPFYAVILIIDSDHSFKSRELVWLQIEWTVCLQFRYNGLDNTVVVQAFEFIIQE